MNKKFFGNDPAFGKTKSFSGQTDPRAQPTRMDSQYTANPRSFRTTADDPYQGTNPLVPSADYYSNPNPAEHVHSFPSNLKEISEMKTEEYALMGLFLSIGLLAILRYST